MTQFHPDRDIAKPNRGELDVRDALERCLNNDWHVVMQPSRFIPKDVRNNFGGAQEQEHDFLLLHRDHGALLLEVKGGDGWNWTAAGLFTTAGEKRASPLDQGHRFEKWFRDLKVGLRVPFTTVPVFPHMYIPERGFGPHVNPREQIIGRAELEANFKQALFDRAPRWEKPRDWSRRESAIHETIRLTAHKKWVTPLARDVAFTVDGLEQQTQRQIKLTDRQYEKLLRTGRYSRTVLWGRAGTGKTIIAKERARRAAMSGASVLFVTPNLRLQDVISETLAREAVLATPQSGDARGVTVVAPTRFYRDAADLRRVLDELAASLWSSSARYNVAVVDEAHDTTPGLLTAIEELVGPSGQVHLFGDEQQRLLADDEAAIPSDAYQVDYLFEICRCSSPIRRLIDLVSPSDGYEDEFPLEKGDIEFIPPSSRTPEALGAMARRRYFAMRELGFAESDLMVVVGSHPSDISDAIVDAIMADDRLPGVEPIRRPMSVEGSRGQEWPVVIFIPTATETSDHRAIAREMYLGASRAQVLLTVFGDDPR